jgi:segregation and condensation protein B
MAKRKKTPKQPPSEGRAQAPAPEPVESSPPAETELEPRAAKPPIPVQAVTEPTNETPPTDESPAQAAPTDLATEATSETSTAEEPGEETPSLPPESSRLVSIIESLLFASDKPLGLAEIKRLLGERDAKKVAAAVESLVEQRRGSGVEVAALGAGWHLRTNTENAAWVSKLLVGRPLRLSRAMLETLAIVAYRQPITRPEIDDIRGVDCGPVLRTLLDRGLVRIIGKKEEVGRPLLYGTTPEFLRVFNLRDLAELPTLREFYDLSAEEQSRVEGEHGPLPEKTPLPSATSPKPEVAIAAVARTELSPEPEENDPLLDELDEASHMAKQALGDLDPAGRPETESGNTETEGGRPEAQDKQDGSGQTPTADD